MACFKILTYLASLLGLSKDVSITLATNSTPANVTGK